MDGAKSPEFQTFVLFSVLDTPVMLEMPATKMQENDDEVDATSIFDRQLQIALKEYRNFEWLGEHSPLASPYFLGRRLSVTTTANTPRQRGEQLSNLLRQAFRQLWEEADPPTEKQFLKEQAIEAWQAGYKQKYYYLLLELRYFRLHYTSRTDLKSRQAILNYLSITKTPYSDALAEARAELATHLFVLVQPTLRLEQIVAPQRLWGRQEMVDSCYTALQTCQTVSLGGGSGVGKTTLAMQIASRWPSTHVFWFTVRPHFNDRLSSFAFALGHFLHQHGQSLLWEQLVASKGQIQDSHMALGLALHDLSQHHDKPFLLCMDEVERLSPLEQAVEQPAYSAMLHFLIGLHHQVAMLLISQRHVLLEADHYVTLSGLNIERVGEWLTADRVHYTPQELAQLHRYTQGNPRLITLLLLYYHENPSIAAVIETLPYSAYVQPLVERIFRYLSPLTRQRLMQLAVFHAPAPHNAFDTDAAFSNLIERQLILSDPSGAIMLMPALREAIYALMKIEEREQFHLQAAQIRVKHGEFTDAVYHYWKANAFEQAIAVWSENQSLEIQRGQAQTALAIFEQISLRLLRKPARDALALIRAELYALAGESTKGLHELDEVQLPPNVHTIRKSTLRGDFLQNLGQPEQAIQAYESGIQTTINWLNQLILLRSRQGLTYIRQREDQNAWRTLQLAKFEVEQLEGKFMDSIKGEFDTALLHYQRALAIAETLNYAEGVAQVYKSLSIVYGKKDNVVKAIQSVKEAIRYYEQIGDALNVVHLKSNLTGIYNGYDYPACIQLATEILPFLQSIQNSLLIGRTASNLAESYFYMGQLEDAETTAQLVLEQEEKEPHPYALYTLGLIRQRQERIQDAIWLLRQSVESAKNNHDLQMLGYALRELGRIHIANGEQEQGREQIKQAINIFTQQGVETLVRETELLLSSPESQ